MKIKTMYATFGKLEEAKIDLSDGLNVIYGENESGKSTWSAFFRVMLYGISTREKSKTGFLADKEKYAPWSGKPMYGKIEFSWQGKDYIMERCSGRSGILQDAKITEVETGKVLDIPEPVGETLLGVRREVFERTAFIAQSQIPISGDKTGELEKKISALTTTGEEDVSQKQVIDRLEKEKRLLRYNRNGEIAELEEELHKVCETIEIAREEAAKLTALHTEIHTLRENEETATKDIERAKVIDARRNLAYIKVAEEDLKIAKEELSAHKSDEKISETQAEEIENKFKLFKEKRDKYTECYNRLQGEPEDVCDELPQGPGAKPAVIASLCALLSCALFFVIGFFAIPVAVAVFVAVFLILNRGFYKKLGVKNKSELNSKREENIKRAQARAFLQEECDRNKAEYDRAEETLNAVLNMLGGGYSAQDVPALLSENKEYREKVKTLLQKVETCAAKLDAVKVGRDIRELESLAKIEIGDNAPVASEEFLREQIRRTREERERLSLQMAALEERISSRGELGALEVKRDELQECLREKNRDYEALDLASTLISEIQKELARKFAPTASKRAGEIFEYLTGEHFKIVQIEDAEMNLKVAENEASPGRNILELSGGTLDELYLSVRLALVEALLSDDVPIVLDDALVNFDDARAERMMNFLEKLSENRQIMVLSCHLREKEFAKSKNLAIGKL